MGAAGTIAPIDFKQRVHAAVFKMVVEFFSNTKSRKSLVQSAKLHKLMLITYTGTKKYPNDLPISSIKQLF